MICVFSRSLQRTERSRPAQVLASSSTVDVQHSDIHLEASIARDNQSKSKTEYKHFSRSVPASFQVCIEAAPPVSLASRAPLCGLELRQTHGYRPHHLDHTIPIKPTVWSTKPTMI
eukprot:5948332-Amphidinium_carterae.1